MDIAAMPIIATIAAATSTMVIPRSLLPSDRRNVLVTFIGDASIFIHRDCDCRNTSGQHRISSKQACHLPKPPLIGVLNAYASRNYLRGSSAGRRGNTGYGGQSRLGCHWKREI